ncbi:MAG: DUF1028 domain-containing protein [Phycisphaerae bacterium]
MSVNHTLRRRSGARVAFLSGVVGLSLLAAPPARATWSIILVDVETHEVAVGSATCLTSFDLRQGLPVVVVDKGGAAAQSFVDVTGANRMLIYDGFQAGISPTFILEMLEDTDAQHETRQYGIVDRYGRRVTFTGTEDGAFADGVIGQQGTMAYSIQGNVLTGAPVVEMAEQAVLTTPGDLPAKLMAGMQAARSMGGDGRCSCSPSDPTGCGSPPPDFDKAAHIGFMIDARTGDVDGACNAAVGCASGNYFMNFNVAFQTPADPDPVFQLQDLFDAWRADLVGRPDAVHSVVTVDPPSFPADGNGDATMTIHIRDWQDTPVDPTTVSVTVAHAPESDEVTAIGPVVDVGGGTFQVQLTGGDFVGTDRFLIRVVDGVRPVVLLPMPTLHATSAADFDGDGDVDRFDYAPLRACMTGPSGTPGDPDCAATDLDLDTDVDLGDVGVFQRLFTDEPCLFLDIIEQVQPVDLLCGETLDLGVGVEAGPDARFQWFLDEVPIPGATDATYHVDAVDNTNAGFYFVRVINGCGIQDSNTEQVRVFPDPCPGP